VNAYIKPMHARQADKHGPEPDIRSATLQPTESPWRVCPLEGAFELSYCDEAGNPSLRRVLARELKIGPGKILLGGIDMADDGYRGFRADRIAHLVDAETGEIVWRNILDWLLNRARLQDRERRRAA
jgi:predicted DNA-binding transcriptional regulator YafY